MLDPNKALVIDEEGFFMMGEKRIVDEELGANLLESIVRKERGTFTCLWEKDELPLEPFDEPLIVQRVDTIAELKKLPAPEPGTFAAERGLVPASLEGARDEVIVVTFPYGVRCALDFTQLSVDQWDRFHGRTPQGIPYVFSRKAQVQFFDLLESFDDDNVSFGGVEYPVKPWMSADPDVRTGAFWTELYQQAKDGWELNAPAPALVDMMPRLKLPKSRVLVLGAGRGNDAAFFAEAGHVVTAVDISPEAVAAGRERYAHLPNITWVEQDLFKLPQAWDGQFDVIFEHTCYCAIDPAQRDQLVRIWNRVLSPGGYLMGVFFVMDRPVGPPFGGTEWELRERLKKHYQFQFWGRWKKSEPRRQGSELFVLANRRRG